MSLNSFEYSNLKHTSIFTWIKELLDGKKAIDVLFVKRNLIRQEIGQVQDLSHLLNTVHTLLSKTQ